ncbi:MAG: HEPN domain-containing protein [Bacteroidia bacterium]|nr:HEPN domain-containing protein [Bacteroidia bacterium]
MKEYQVLLDISSYDLQSSKLLFENKLFPQAIFYFQQAIEKLVKFIGLSSNFIKKEDLSNSKIGHKTIKIFRKSIELYCQIFPNANNLNIDKEYITIQNFFSQENPYEIILTVINQIENLNISYQDVPINFPNINNLIDFLDKFYPNNPNLSIFRICVDNKEFNESLNNKLQEFNMILPGYIKSVVVLFFLDGLFSKHAINSRYPNINDMINPSVIYNIENPLVYSLPYFQDKLFECQNGINSII